MLKRLMDVILASFGLFVLTPVLLMVALAVKLDSPGPVLFRQRRHGFNQRAFWIVKFRTMTVQDDGDVIRQATRTTSASPGWAASCAVSTSTNCRSSSMCSPARSLVGPRPHALAHDREYDDRIALYARRHNVKPGITGWAQVHGLRGETDTEDKMKARVEHDLYYIDNWSLLLDIEILFRTVFSRKAYANAI